MKFGVCFSLTRNIKLIASCQIRYSERGGKIKGDIKPVLGCASAPAGSRVPYFQIGSVRGKAAHAHGPGAMVNSGHTPSSVHLGCDGDVPVRNRELSLLSVGCLFLKRILIKRGFTITYKPYSRGIMNKLSWM